MVRSIIPDFSRFYERGLSGGSSGLQRRSASSSLIACATPALALASLLLAVPASSQVLTIDTHGGNGPHVANAPVDRMYQQIQPTHVELSKTPMGTRNRLELVRVIQAEQGFAMRPLLGGHKGMVLEANGKLNPAGEAYLNMATSNGVSVKPGGRVVITDVKIDHNKLVIDLNNGPDAKHRFLRHISIGTDPYYDTPVVNGADDPGGARLTLVFKDRVPELTGAQVKALLAPLISFDVKTPVQAYTDTLPKPLKQAILDHEVLVGMNTDMVIFAKGQPQTKYHEMEGQMPVDIWMYGKPPEDVTFVRINGNRVIRVELAKTGQPTQVFTKDVVAQMMRDAGQPVITEAENVHVIHQGDVHRNPDTQAPAPPPSLRNPGESVPDDGGKKDTGEMKPVYFPKKQPDSNASPYPGGGKQQGSQAGSQQGSQTSSGGQQQSGQTAQQGSAPAQNQPAAAPQKPQPVTVGGNPDDQQN